MPPVSARRWWLQRKKLRYYGKVIDKLDCFMRYGQETFPKTRWISTNTQRKGRAFWPSRDWLMSGPASCGGGGGAQQQRPHVHDFIGLLAYKFECDFEMHPRDKFSGPIQNWIRIRNRQSADPQTSLGVVTCPCAEVTANLWWPFWPKNTLWKRHMRRAEVSTLGIIRSNFSPHSPSCTFHEL